MNIWIIVLGNILAFIGMALLWLSSIQRTKQRMLFCQVIDSIFCTASNIVLGGFTGAIVVFMSLVRNLLAYKNMLTPKITMALLVLTTIIGLYVNKHGYIGILPIIATIEYTLWLGFGNNTAKGLKIALIINMLIWSVYDLTIYAFTTLGYDVAIVTSTLYSLYKTRNDKESA